MAFAIISTHAYFYPRPPWGGRLDVRDVLHHVDSISIHALRGEGDPQWNSFRSKQFYFYPRPPWGGRHPGNEFYMDLVFEFLSTPSVGRATY